MKKIRLSRLGAALAALAAVALLGGCGSSVPIIISPPPTPAPVPLPPPPPEPPPPEAETFSISMPGAAARPDRAADTEQLRADNATGYRPASLDERMGNEGNDGNEGNGSNANDGFNSGNGSTSSSNAGNGANYSSGTSYGSGVTRDSLPGSAGGVAGKPSNAPVRMGLILPLRSETLGAAADALRAGFMAGWERDRDNTTVTVIETGDVAQDILSSYAQALERNDIIVGPLARSAVTAIANSALVSKPTIALNHPDGAYGTSGTSGTPGAAALPQQMLTMGLSIEEEARQVAQWAASEHPGASALVLTTGTPWQRRIAAAFAAHWQQRGLAVQTVELNAPNNYVSDADLVQLRARLQQQPPGLLFSAMGADQTRQVRAAINDKFLNGDNEPVLSTAEGLPAAPTAPPAVAPGDGVPLYGTSALNAGEGVNSPTNELDGVRLLDLPWQVQRDHPAVMVYPRPLPAGTAAGTADMARLYALGIDAYRVAREISRHPAGRFHLDGVTGRLTVDFGQGPARFERIEQPAEFKAGVPQPVQP